MNNNVDGPTINHINDTHMFLFIDRFMKIILVQFNVDGPTMDIQCRLLLQEIHRLHGHFFLSRERQSYPENMAFPHC
jgi:hypothetical protein